MAESTEIRYEDNYLEYDEAPQEERRHRLLEFQRRSAENAVNTARGLLLDIFFPEHEEEVMHLTNYRCKTTTREPKYKHKVMLSEWMLEPPQDFVENWIMIPCPVGKRILLVAGKGVTKVYDKKGNKISTFQSALPGGNVKGMRAQFTILDCIWSRENDIYYVLDVIAWAKEPTINWEAEVRLPWIHTHLAEIEALKERNTDVNEHPILCLQSVNCSADLSSALAAISNHYLLDGLIFFHKNGRYMFGTSSLVIWLKHFMLPEILGISVPSPLDEKPNGYIDYKHFIYRSTRNRRQKEFFCSYFGIENE